MPFFVAIGFVLWLAFYIYNLTYFYGKDSSYVEQASRVASARIGPELILEDKPAFLRFILGAEGLDEAISGTLKDLKDVDDPPPELQSELIEPLMLLQRLRAGEADRDELWSEAIPTFTEVVTNPAPHPWELLIYEKFSEGNDVDSALESRRIVVHGIALNQLKAAVVIQLLDYLYLYLA